MILRPYQCDCVDAVLRELETNRSTLFVLPTGGGKTIVFASLINRVKGRVMVLAHRQELIRQAADKIKRVTGIDCAVEMGQSWANEGWFKPRVVVSSIQTQNSGARGEGRMSRFDPKEFDLVITDECHHSISDSWVKVIDYYKQNPALKVVGCTATPDRSDEEALGQVFDTVAFDYELPDAINDGWLVPIKQRQVFVDSLDFSKVRTTAGDLNGADLAAIMESEEHLHAIADPLFQIAAGRRTIVFCVRVAHAERLAEIFNRHQEGCAGIVSGETPKDDRKRVFERFHNGEITFLCNVGVCTEGYDEPLCEVIGMARPTKSRALYAQCVGRGTRPLPDTVDGLETPQERCNAIAASAKAFTEVVDFTGNSGRHSLITSADILGGKYSGTAIERAKKNIEASGLAANVIDELKKAEAQLERERIAREAEEAEQRKRKIIVGTAKFRSSMVNPFDVLGLTPVKSRGWDNVKTITPRQTELLAKNGIETKGMTFSQVSQLIGEVLSRRAKGLASYKQAKLLQKHGYDKNMSFADAKATIDALAANGWKRPAAQPQPVSVGMGDADGDPF